MISDAVMTDAVLITGGTGDRSVAMDQSSPRPRAALVAGPTVRAGLLNVLVVIEASGSWTGHPLRPPLAAAPTPARSGPCNQDRRPPPPPPRRRRHPSFGGAAAAA